jgi:hypothetical protein
MRFQMHMNRMPPAPTAVPQNRPGRHSP